MIDIFADIGWIQAIALAAVLIAPMIVFGGLTTSLIQARKQRVIEELKLNHERKIEKMKLDHEVDSALLTSEDDSN